MLKRIIYRRAVRIEWSGSGCASGWISRPWSRWRRRAILRVLPSLYLRPGALVLARLIRIVVSTAVSLFYRLERRGPAVPAGPVILAANHPNSLLDPIILFATGDRTARPLAKAPLFERAVVGRLIRWVGGIPVYRREDDPSQMDRNDDTFRAATAALRAGDAIQIFPEGRSHSDPQLSPLRTGAARIALAAESEAAWSLGLGLVPVGLTYARKALFRGRVVARYGEAIPVARWRDAFERDPQAAARELTGELERRLRALTLNLTESEDGALIDTAEKMWAREKGLHAPRARPALSDRLPRLQAFAAGLAWLRVHDPARHQRLREEVSRYHRAATLLGVGEGDVPVRYRGGPTLRWVAVELLPTALLLPVAALAGFVWGVPYRLVGWVVTRLRLPTDMVATYKVAASLVAYPLFLALWAALAAWTWGWAGAVGAVVGLPLLGVLAVRWLDHARDVMEDLRLFGRVAGRARQTERLARKRRALVAEFEAVQGILDNQGAPTTPQSSPLG